LGKYTKNKRKSPLFFLKNEKEAIKAKEIGLKSFSIAVKY